MATRIVVDRAWIGAHAGSTVTNPTVWLFVVTVTLAAAGVGGWAAGFLPAPVAVVLNTVAIYLAFTVLHEAMHRIADADRRVNDALGRVAGWMLLVGFPMFRAVHYEHHSHTNDPERDPDLFVARGPLLLLPLRLAGVVLEYRRAFYGRRLWKNAAERSEAIATDLALVALTATAIATGWGTALLVLWLAPATLAVVFLAFAFDFVPHYPYDTAERYYDTRIIPSRTLNGVLLGQN
ncbi:MAG: fatty acid desaturase, partial [Candidatus Binatia bacterium]